MSIAMALMKRAAWTLGYVEGRTQEQRRVLGANLAEARYQGLGDGLGEAAKARMARYHRGEITAQDVVEQTQADCEDVAAKGA